MELKSEHRSTARVLDILEQVSQNDQGYTLTELCTVLDAPKSSLFPIIHTMRERGYLVLDKASGRYHMGQMTFQVGSAYLNNLDAMDEIEKEMRQIVEQCGEACHLAVLNGGDVLYLKKIDSPEPIRMISNIGKRLPAYGTGLGKSLLCDYTPEELKALYPNGLAALTEFTITNMEELCRQLHQTRVIGFSFEKEESNLYIRCVAVPIRKKGKIICALSVAIPTFRYSEEKQRQVQYLLTAARHKIEKLLEHYEIHF